MNGYTKIKDFDGARSKGVGSSDIPTLAGLNRHYEPRPYLNTVTGQIEKLRQTTYTLWRLKRGELRQLASGSRMEWGHRLEPVILSRFLEERIGKDASLSYLAAALRGRSCGALKTLTECRMPERRYVLAHADLLMDPAPAAMAPASADGLDAVPLWPSVIVEAKSSGCYAAKRIEGQVFTGYDPDDFSYQGIPDSVYLQVQWQMLAYGVPVAYVAVLIDTGDYREYGPIPAAPRVQERCLALAERFWGLVEEGRPPKPETWTDVSAMWPEPKDTTAMLAGEDEMKAREYVAEYQRLAAKTKEIETRREELLSAIGIYMGENSMLTTAEGVKLASSWTASTAPSVKLSDVRECDPKLYALLEEGGYISRSSYRRIQPAKIKEA